MNVLVTGGASGLGEAITRKLSTTASKVYFTYCRSSQKARALEASFSNCEAIACDFSDGVSVKNLCERIGQMNLDLLVNNAYSGGFIQSHFHKTPSSDFHDSFLVNVLPVIHITQSVINEFRKKKSGRIITLLTAALQGNPPVGASMYVANKAYLEELVKVWATENLKFGISSNAISPSFVPTGFADNMDERILEQMKEAHPLKRFLTPEEVADAVAFMAQPSRHMNGENLRLDAGITLS